MPETPPSSPTPSPPATRARRRLVLRIAALALASFLLWFVPMTWSVVRAPVAPLPPPLIVNDVSQLNPIQVGKVITPTTTAEIVGSQEVQSSNFSLCLVSGKLKLEL